MYFDVNYVIHYHSIDYQASLLALRIRFRDDGEFACSLIELGCQPQHFGILHTAFLIALATLRVSIPSANAQIIEISCPLHHLSPAFCADGNLLGEPAIAWRQ